MDYSVVRTNLLGPNTELLPTAIIWGLLSGLLGVHLQSVGELLAGQFGEALVVIFLIVVPPFVVGYFREGLLVSVILIFPYILHSAHIEVGSGPIRPSLLELLPMAAAVALGIAVIGYLLGRFVAIGNSYVGD